ncbi:hypothetical protein GCM10025865_07630 [Paraoerskovia sediminicola]|uniref:HTH tetR-type domain-containing protein n=1 Tax=Paraoerskovia sediminicola TaxID=1138587 RepID=A0ABN6X9K9_9CELL|nr:TetR/AcrR family transcriptional regulator [Paraoerskovia sediminicola]BDZ41464.1 hypothetical protein GCM10025865_07630 [Paraoerskovia sediminicola]
MSPAARRDASAWVDAAYDAFASAGLEAVKVEPVARALGATKGSFYWHFTDRQALVDAVLARWETETEEIISEVEAAPGGPTEQLATLFAAVTRRRSPGWASSSSTPRPSSPGSARP